MDLATAQRLTTLTSNFYDTVSESFSATRKGAWPGWQQVLATSGLQSGESIRIIDVACGNLRFERFLCDQGVNATTWALDNCAPLVGEVPPNVTFVPVDLARVLFEDSCITTDISACDLAVSFGFAHHLPLPMQRENLMKLLVDLLRPGGIAAISFWQFAQDARLLRKARDTTAQASAELGLTELGTDDYLLGWQDRSDVWRYCHHFSEDEISRLAGAVSEEAREVTRFSADGRSGSLNRYLVLKRI